VLEFPWIDLGDAWLNFALPHAELAVQPGDGEFVQIHAEHAMLGGQPAHPTMIEACST